MFLHLITRGLQNILTEIYFNPFFFQLGEGVSLQVDKWDKPEIPEFVQRDSIDGNVELCKAHDSVSIDFIP